MEIFSAKGTRTRRWRKDGFLESVVEGVVEAAYKTDKILEDVNLTGLEKLCNVPSGYLGVPTGFVRELSSITISTDGTRLEFRFVDVEQPTPPTTEDDPKPIIVE